MSNGIAKNIEKVAEGWATLGKLWKVRVKAVKAAVDDKDWKAVLHHVGAGFLSDALQALYRTFLYITILGTCVYLGALFLPYEWPLSWTGF